jgi:hypothetical protein
MWVLCSLEESHPSVKDAATNPISHVVSHTKRSFVHKWQQIVDTHIWQKRGLFFVVINYVTLIRSRPKGTPIFHHAKKDKKKKKWCSLIHHRNPSIQPSMSTPRPPQCTQLSVRRACQTPCDRLTRQPSNKQSGEASQWVCDEREIVNNVSSISMAIFKQRAWCTYLVFFFHKN